MALLRVLLIRCPMIASFRLDLSKSRNLQHLSLEPIHGSAWRATSSTIISQELTVLNLWIKRVCCLQDCICCLDVLKACPKVEWFGLKMEVSVREIQRNNFRSELNKLGSITLHNLKTMNLVAGLIPSDFFFQKLVTPFLIRLEYHFPSGVINYSSLRIFLQNSGSQLEELLIDNKRDEIDNMISIGPIILSLLPRLRRLELHGQCISPNFWKILMRNKDDDSDAIMLIPKLEMLEIVHPPDHFIDEGCDIFADMLVYRWRYNNEFQVRIVSEMSDIIRKSLSDHELLQECISNGFKFSI